MNLIILLIHFTTGMPVFHEVFYSFPLYACFTVIFVLDICLSVRFIQIISHYPFAFYHFKIKEKHAVRCVNAFIQPSLSISILEM